MGDTNTGGGGVVGGNVGTGGGDNVGHDKIQIRSVSRSSAKSLADINHRMMQLEEEGRERGRVIAEIQSRLGRQEDTGHQSIQRIEDMITGMREDMQDITHRQSSYPTWYQVLSMIMAIVLIILMIFFIRATGTLPSGVAVWPW